MVKTALISKNIKKARVSLGLSQKELAKKLGVSNKTISAYETGRAIPPALTIAKLAKVTHVEVGELIGVKNKENEIMKSLKGIRDELTDRTNGEVLADRMKIDVFVGVVLVDRKDRVFLIKEQDKYRISRGRWNLPGGSVDNSETLLTASERETEEETGYKVKVTDLVGCYKCKKGESSWVYVVFSAKPLGKGGSAVDPGVKKGKWFTKDEFLKMEASRMVHPDMKLVYKISIENRGLSTESVKFIDYDE